VGASRKAERLVGALEELGAGLGDLGLALIKAAKYEDEEGGRSGAYTLSASASKAIAAEAKRVGTARPAHRAAAGVAPRMRARAPACFRCLLRKISMPARRRPAPMRAGECAPLASAKWPTARAPMRTGAHHMRAAPGRARPRAGGRAALKRARPRRRRACGSRGRRARRLRRRPRGSRRCTTTWRCRRCGRARRPRHAGGRFWLHVLAPCGLPCMSVMRCVSAEGAAAVGHPA